MTRRTLAGLAAVLLTVAMLAPAAVARPQRRSGNGPRVIGGQESAPGQWPWQVAILDAGTANTYDAFFCGGTVISRSWILTAAHCVSGRSPAGIQVLTGTNVLGNGSGHRYAVAAIRSNPAWDGGSNQNDEALIRLSKPTSAPPIAIVSAAQRALWTSGKVATVSGWGDTSTNPLNSNYPTRLRHVQIPIQSDATCAAEFPPSRGAIFTFFASSMVCAGPLAGGRDTCNGDSGGPLMVPGPGGAGWVQVGITSWGYGCALADNPGVYSRLGASAMARFVSQTKRFGPFDDVNGFIARQFVDFAHRFPTAAELNRWRAHLADHPPRDLVAALESSSTWQRHGWAVARLFRATFLRDPDTSGLTHWIGRSFAGVPLRSVASSFTGSVEYTRRYGHLSAGAFVDLVYRNVLGRTADNRGRTYWIRRLTAGATRGSMMASFSQSHEYRARSYNRVRATTTWFGLLQAAPSAHQLDAIQATPIDSVIDSLRGSYSYAARF